MAVNRVVLHVWPVKSSQVPESHRNPDGSMRPHILSRRVVDEGGDKAVIIKPEDCWCGPTVSEWRERPDGRMGWVVVEPAKPQDGTTAVKGEE